MLFHCPRNHDDATSLRRLGADHAILLGHLRCPRIDRSPRKHRYLDFASAPDWPPCTSSVLQNDVSTSANERSRGEQSAITHRDRNVIRPTAIQTSDALDCQYRRA